MIIIDECHHFVKDQNEAPTRLRELAEKIVYNSPGLLLLSATPFTGSKAEFHSLLKLLDPKFQSENFAQKWDPSNLYLIRRLKGHIKDKGEQFWDRQIIEVKVTEHNLSIVEQELLSEVITCLTEYQASPEAETWDRLMEETARKRLSSSWEAFYETITGSGRLSSWFSESIKAKIRLLIEQQESGKLRKLHNVLGDIHSTDKNAKIVIFTEAIPTQDAICKYLVDKSGYEEKQVAAIRSETSKDDRLQIEDRFSNPDSDLRVLVATDTISEGKDLQYACNHLVHYELPWSLVKIEQRNGRIDRFGQKKIPYIYNLVFDTKATPDQKILNRLNLKSEKAKEALGSVNPIIARFGNLTSDDFRNDAEDRLDKEIDAATEETKSFGLGTTSLTFLSASPILNEEDFEGRRLNLKIMLETLGGKIEPYGQTGDQFLLSLPENPKWDLPGLEAVREPYPSIEKPWRVTFQPKIYVEYENYRRKHGEGREPLRFLSPVHTIALQIESRFRNRLAKKNYPIFRVSNAAHDFVLIVELSARAPSSRILAQQLTALELGNFSEIPLDVVDAELKGIDGPVALPNSWKHVESKLTDIASSYVRNLKRHYEDRKNTFVEEHKSIPDEIKGKQERGLWIEDLWTVDENQAQFQILALLVAGR